MDVLLERAILGTARAPGPASDGDPRFVRLLPPTELEERRLLLLSGMRAVHRLAGAAPVRSSRALEGSGDEDLPACSTRCAEVLARVLRDHPIVLPECASLLAARGRRVPFDLLPVVLSVTDAGHRDALRPVVGSRGKWLAAFEPEWRWILATGPQILADTSNAAAVFEEGTPAERIAALKEWREREPAKAREAVAAAFAREKADFRVSLLEAFSSGISETDEAFLEACLDDRSAAVRAAAAASLARLPGSALARRMTERADGMVALASASPKSGLLAKIGSVLGGARASLTVQPPTDLPRDWERDGLGAQAVAGEGKRSSWVSAVLMHVAPSHWAARLQLEPAEIVALAREGDWEGALVGGWCRAAIRFGAVDWIGALWDQLSSEKNPDRGQLESLARHMSDADLRSRVMAMTSSPDAALFPLLVSFVKRPWDDLLSRRWVAGLEDFVAKLARSGRTGNDPWMATLPHAAVGLCPASLGSAIGPWSGEAGLSPEDPWQRTWLAELEKMREILRVRASLWESEP